MKLYLISQSEQLGYDTYDSAVVAAPNKEVARCISPSLEFLLGTFTAKMGKR